MKQYYVGDLPVDGLIKNARWHPFYHKSIMGNIYHDAKGRFEDGTEIHTSTVTEISKEGIAITRNSIYKVEMAE